LVSLVAAALGVLLLTGTNVWADPVPWSYIASPQPAIAADGGGPSLINIAANNGSGSGNSGIIIYNMTLKGSTTSTDTFTGVPFSLSLSLTDLLATSPLASGAVNASGTVNFTGKFSATNVTSTSLFPVTNLSATGGPIIGGVQWTTTGANAAPGSTFLSPSSAYVKLGSDGSGWSYYTVTLGSFAAPGPNATTNNPGSIQALVTLDGSPPQGFGDTPPSATPEPASLVLAGLGLPFFVLLRRRMKKAQAEATIA
jgi:hypothetical protein